MIHNSLCVCSISSAQQGGRLYVSGKRAKGIVRGLRAANLVRADCTQKNCRQTLAAIASQLNTALSLSLPSIPPVKLCKTGSIAR